MRDDPVDELYRLVAKLTRRLEDVETQITTRGTPGAHATSHQNGGSDEINVAGLSGELADAQPPKAHASTHQSGGSDAITSFGNLTINGKLGTAQTLLTIASGVITVTGGYHRVDTQGSAASDDLDTINGGVLGMRVVLQTQASTRDVTVKHLTGNIRLAGGADCTLGDVYDKLELIYTQGSRWEELCRANNA